MEREYPMNERELLYKSEYETRLAEYYKKPMSIWEFIDLGEDVVSMYPELMRYQHDETGTLPGHIMKDVEYFDGDYLNLVYTNRYSLPVLHLHTFIEILYVYRGKCIHFVNDMKMEMTTGDLCIISPNVTHATSVENDDTIVFAVMMSKKLFDERFQKVINQGEQLSKYFRQIFHGRIMPPYLLYHTVGDLYIREVVAMLNEEFQQKTHMYKEVMNLYIRQLFIHLIRNYEDKAFDSGSLVSSLRINTSDIIDYVRANYRTATLAKVAATFGYNEVYLGKMIQKYSGKSFADLVTECQMLEAKKLLEEDVLTITQIGCEVGCYDASHFNRKFRRFFGVSPTAYKKELNKSVK